AGGDIPETWQTHPGGELGDYVAQGVLEPLDKLYAANGWRKVVPADLIKSMTYNGHVYAVLTNTHRANVLWVNKALFKQAGVTIAVDHFDTALGWTNGDHKSQDWAGAVAELATGKCAMNLMGDWAYGELKVKWKQVDGKDFGYTILGDPNTFVTVGDAFVIG